MSERLSDQNAAEADLPFRQVAQALPTPCWISDAEGSIIWVNEAWLAYTGYDLERIQREGLQSLHAPAMYKDVQTRWAEVKALGQPAEMVFPLKGRDGTFRPFMTRVVPLRDGRGQVTRWFGTNTDISGQSKIEAELYESQRRLELATEAAALGIWDWNILDNTFVYSARARAICGFAPDAAIMLDDVIRSTHPDDFPQTWTIAQRALDPAIRAVERYRYRIIRTDGEVRIIEAHGQALFETMPDGQERAVRYVGTMQDVTEVTRLAERSREAQALLGSLFEASQLYIAVVEITGDSFRYILANRATAEFYGQPSNAEGFDAREIGIPEEEIGQWRQTLLEIWSSQTPRTMEYAFDGGHGEGWYIGTYTPLPSGPSGEPRISFVVVDVTDRKRAEERQALLMREVDHRAKNALAVALAIVQLTRAESLDAFRRAVEGRMASLARVHTLLADERWTGARLGRLVRDELAPYETEPASRIQIDGLDHALSPAVAQTVGLVIHELATNAAKHGALSTPNGDVRVKWGVDAAGDLTFVWTERSGRPPPELQRRGFGFTMLEQLIEKQLGGQWRLERRLDGLSFTIVLPSGRAEVERKPDEPERAGEVRAFIIEDEALVAMALEEELADRGITVTATASSLAEANALLGQLSFDLALVDLNLAGESTIGVARKLRDAGAAVVFCTGYASTGLPEDLSSYPVLGKPFQARDLDTVLRPWMRTPA